MNILVAGGAGFLGTNLTNRLLKDGHAVTVIDNFLTGKRSNLPEHPQLTVVEHDIIEELPNFPAKFDVVVNMACLASPPAYQSKPLETLRVNSLGTEHLLKLANDHKARFVQASTSEVYGDPLVHPQTEDYWGNVNPYGARAMYDEGKRYAEALIWIYRQLYGTNTGIIRIFNTYGPFMSANDGRVVTNFLHQAGDGKKLTIFGDGKQTRSFCYVDDQIEGWIKMINSDVEGPVNIGNPNEFTLLELIEVIEKVLGKKVEVEFKPLPADDPKQRQPDISRAKELLDWEPKIQLEDGIRKLTSWLDSSTFK